MTFSDPSIVLTYMDSSTTATIGKQYIIKNSIQVREQLLNGLESSSSTIQLSLDSSCPEIPYILNAESDIKAVLRDGVSVIWTGYVSDGFSWTVGPAGTSVLRIVLEDIGSKLLEKPYIRGERAQLIDDNGLAAITSICSVAGITVSSTVPTITTPVIRVVKEGERCKDLLRTLCFELGYAYYFNGAGELCLKKIDCVSVTGIPVLNKDDLYIVGGKGLQLDKKVRQYKSAVLSFKEYATKTGVLVYKDISGQTTGYPDCKIPMTAGGYYPASSISSYQAQDLEGGAEVVYLSNVTGSIGWKDGGAGTATISKQSGANSIGVRVACSSSGTLSKLQATGDIVVVSAESEVSQGEVSASGESDNCYTRELQWIHTNTVAAPIANMVVDFYKYCNRQFTFRAEDDYACGDLVKVYDDQFSGIAVNLLIYAKEYSDESEIVTYRAYSVSPFNLGRAATTITTRTPTTDVNVFIPESDVVSCNLVVTPQIFYKDYRDTSSATISFKYFYNGNSTPPANLVWSAVTNTGYSYTVTTDSATEAHISVAHNTSASSLTISAYVTGMQTSTYVETKLTYEDITEYNKNWGTLTALPSGIVLDGDYFIAGSNFSSYVLGKPYVRSNSAWTNLTANTVENTTKLFNLLSNVMASDLTVPSTSAMYAWFGTLVAQDAAIQNLFSKNITILDPGSIHSSSFNDDGTPVNPEYSAEVTKTGSAITVTLNSSTWFSDSSRRAAGTYSWTCDDSNDYWDPDSSNPIRNGASTANMYNNYGISISGSPAKYNTVTVTVTNSPAVAGFYLGSDGSFVCNSANANNIAITGNSIFEGKFNTGVLNTLVNPASSTDFYSNNTWSQAKVHCQGLSSAGYPMGSYLGPVNPIRCDIKNVTSSVYYINYYMSGGSYQIHFWDKDLNELNIRNIVTCTKNGGNYTNYLWSSDNGSIGQWVSGGITLVIWSGGNLLEVDIPDKDYASGNPSGTLFRGPQTTVNNITCYPVYVKA